MDGERPLARVFGLDMRGRALAAVADNSEILRPRARDWAEYKRHLGLRPETPYFNSGALLLDLARYTAEGVAERAVEYVVKGGYMGTLDDRSVLNATLKGGWTELSPLWNWMYATRDEMTRRYRPFIIHFGGKSKPWDDWQGRYHPRYAAVMKDYLSTAWFPNFVKPQRPWRQARRRAKNLMREAISSAGLAPWLDERDGAIRRNLERAGSVDRVLWGLIDE
jgi:lipopolysaccharide biosynthesis glycosyltransferase